MLSIGRANALGRTPEVVEAVLADPRRLDELLSCYDRPEEGVRLRASNALKRIERARPAVIADRAADVLEALMRTDQPSARWTLAQLALRLGDAMGPGLRNRTLQAMKEGLEGSDDWIVLTQTVATLSAWAGRDPVLLRWLRPRLERLSADHRKAISGRARKALDALS